MKHFVEQIRLKNGAKGLLIDVPDATVMDFDFEFRAGNRFVEDNSIYEVAHIMEHMAFGANARFSDGLDYETDFTKNGAYHNAFTSDNFIGYVAECADFEWERILDLQLLAITEPRFNQRELDAERGNVRNELTGYWNNYNRVLWQKMGILMGADWISDRERVKLLNNVKLADIKHHFTRTHTAQNLRFIISGNLQGRKTKIKQYLENAKFGMTGPLEFSDDTFHKIKPVFIKKADASNLTFGLTFNLPRRLKDDEVDAMECVNHILTGTLSSRILGQARSKGLIYGMWSETTRGLKTSSWEFGGQVNAETAKELFEIIKREVSKVLAGEISDADIQTAESYFLGRHQMRMQTVGAVGGFYTNRFMYFDETEDFASVPRRIKNISREKMVAVAQEFVKNDISGLGIVGKNQKELAEELAKIFGNLTKA